MKVTTKVLCDGQPRIGAPITRFGSQEVIGEILGVKSLGDDNYVIVSEVDDAELLFSGVGGFSMEIKDDSIPVMAIIPREEGAGEQMKNKCSECDKEISQFEYKNCVEMCLECYARDREQYVMEMGDSIIRDMAWRYVKLMREYDMLVWDDLDGFEDKTDEELVEILRESYAIKNTEKA